MWQGLEECVWGGDVGLVLLGMLAAWLCVQVCLGEADLWGGRCAGLGGCVEG